MVVEICFFFHVISQDHVIKGPCDFIGRRPSRYVTILPSLIRYNIIAFSFDVISEDHMVRGSYDFMDESPSCQVTTLPILVDIGIEVVEL